MDNPYKPPEFLEKVSVLSAGIVRIAIAFLAFLFGVGFFGLGIHTTWMTVTMDDANLWLNVATVSKYLLFGASFLASSWYVFRGKSGKAFCLFIAPFIVVGILLVVFGF